MASPRNTRTNLYGLINDISEEIITKLNDGEQLDRFVKKYITQPQTIHEMVNDSIMRVIPTMNQCLFKRIFANKYKHTLNKYLSKDYSFPLLIFDEELNYMIIEKMEMKKKLHLFISEYKKDSTINKFITPKIFEVDGCAYDIIYLITPNSKEFLKFQISYIYMSDYALQS